MARYISTVRSDRSVADTFAYMADLRNFAEWDPGVRKVTQVKGSGGGPGSEFDVTVAGPAGREMTLRYRTTEYDEPRELLAVAATSTLTSRDRVTVRSEGGTTIVTYDADLQLRGLLRLADPVLRLAFKRIGDRAAAGLRRALGSDGPVR